MRNHIAPLIGPLPVSALSDHVVRAFVMELRSRVSKSTASTIMTVVRAAIDEACVQGLLLRNPARTLPRNLRVGHSAGPRRALAKVEVEGLFAVLPPAADWARPLFMTCVLAGLRSGEVRGLHWCDIDFGAERIRVRRQATAAGTLGPLKTPTSRRDVVLLPELSQELRRYKATLGATATATSLVFQGRTGVIHASLARNRLLKAVKQAGIDHVTIHDLRRTFGSILIAANADVTYVQHQMGHASPAVTLTVYANLWDQERNIEKVATYVSTLELATKALRCESLASV